MLLRMARALNLLTPEATLSACVQQTYLSQVVPKLLENIGEQLPGDKPGSSFDVSVDDHGSVSRERFFTSGETQRLRLAATRSFRADFQETGRLIDDLISRVCALNGATQEHGCYFEFRIEGSGRNIRQRLTKSYEGETISEADRSLASRCAGRLPVIGNGVVAEPLQVLFRAAYKNFAFGELIRFRYNMWAVHHESWYSREDAFEELLRREIRFKMDDLTSRLAEYVPALEENFSARAREAADKQERQKAREAARKKKADEAVRRRELLALDRRKREDLKLQFARRKDVGYKASDGFLVTGNNGPLRVHYAACPTVATQRQIASAGEETRRYPALMTEGELQSLRSFRVCATCKPKIRPSNSESGHS